MDCMQARAKLIGDSASKVVRQLPIITNGEGQF